MKGDCDDHWRNVWAESRWVNPVLSSWSSVHSFSPFADMQQQASAARATSMVIKGTYMSRENTNTSDFRSPTWDDEGTQTLMMSSRLKPSYGLRGTLCFYIDPKPGQRDWAQCNHSSLCQIWSLGPVWSDSLSTVGFHWHFEGFMRKLLKPWRHIVRYCRLSCIFFCGENMMLLSL